MPEMGIHGMRGHVQAPGHGAVRETLRHQPRRFAELLLVVAVLRHAQRNDMRREDERRRGSPLGGQLLKRFLRALDHRLDEAGVVVEHAELLDLRRSFAHFGLSGGEILAILPAA